MKPLFFIILSLLSLLWLYLSFHFFGLDPNKMLGYNEVFSNILFEIIFFVWIFVFGFFLWRYFWFNIKIEKKVIKKERKNPSNIFDQKSDNDNLKIIEWVWPKIEKLLKLNWINTLKDLSESGYEEIKIILERAGDNFKIVNPRSWPYQAELADTKEWNKLKEYQDFLVWGVNPEEFKK